MIRIIDVKIKTPYAWNHVKALGDWKALRNTNSTWDQPKQTAVVGSIVNIEVEVIENNWDRLMDIHPSWGDISSKYSNWNAIKNL